MECIFYKNTIKEFDMKNFLKLKAMRSIAIIALAAVIGFTFAACGGGGGSTETYTGRSDDGTTYTFKIIQNTARYIAKSGDNYILTGGGKTSTGEIQNVVDSGGQVTHTLRPSASGRIFTAVVSPRGLIRLTGTIWWDDKSYSTAPGTLTGTN
jgi:hypothetical protein